MWREEGAKWLEWKCKQEEGVRELKGKPWEGV